VKDLLGHSSLKWDVNKQQGAYTGPVYDHNKADHSTIYKKKPTNDDAWQNHAGRAAAASMLCQEPEKQKRDPETQHFVSSSSKSQPEPLLSLLNPSTPSNVRERGAAMRGGAAIRNGGPEAHELGGTSAPSVLSTRPW
jgi:hypothetical protein